MKASLEDFKILSAEVVQTLDPHTIDGDLSFFEAGLDSLDTFALFLKTEEKYGFSIPAHDVSNIKTFRDLLNYSNDKLSQQTCVDLT